MEREIAVSFNLTLQGEIVSKLIEVQQILTKTIPELRHYDATPHLAIATKFMHNTESTQYVEALQKEFANEKAFTLEFSHISPSETGSYIFLHLSEDSRIKMFSLRERALNCSKGIGNESPMGLPPRYPYDPHISIIKLPIELVPQALSQINANFEGFTITIPSFEVSKETRDDTGYAGFPIIGKIILT